MEENNDIIQPNPPRRRRKRTKWQNFKEAYLPVLIVLVAVILIIVFVTSSFKRAKGGETTDPASQTTTEPSVDISDQLQQEADSLLSQAEVLAAQYDYQAAINLLNTYSGGVNNSPELLNKINAYTEAYNALVPVEDLSSIPNLCVRLLIADLDRALADTSYGTYDENYITTTEFKAILQDLYDNGYMLVSIYDIATKRVDADGNVTISAGDLRLPEGKKPLVLTQEAVNYFTYMVDSDGDGLADAGGDGMASRLIIDPTTGKLTNEMVDASGNTVTGAFDLIPILNEFVEAHPDFSYKGAKAIISLTGYDGLFGYRTDPDTATAISQDYYDQQLADVAPIIAKVKADGYDLACFTYGYERYDSLSNADIQADLDKWKAEVTPLLGEVDILVYPYGSDIGSTTAYSGSKYTTLKEAGFNYFITMGTDYAWGQFDSAYFRQSRLWISGQNMIDYPNRFEKFFDASSVLDPGRTATTEPEA